MNAGGRQAPCPSCGGPIEFKLGSSAAMVCPWCRHSVIRSGVSLEDHGKIADLVPTAAVMAVGDYGVAHGEEFVVGGRLQLDHGKGPWDEWYVEFPMSRRWGWLASAQGKWYLTFPQDGSQAPPYQQMSPGGQGVIPGAGELTWTVAERGESRLVSAEGELPFPSKAGEHGYYVDLSGPGGAFGTIDYGDGTGPAKLFVGHELPHDAISWKEGNLGPRPTEKLSAQKLSCPTCGSPVDIQVPDSTERAACASCHSLLDFSSGNLAFLRQLQQPAIQPYIPLGSEGELRGIPHIAIGFMERCTIVEGITYAWREYLFHTPQGYRWLMEDSGHFTYLAPINAGDVEVTGSGCSYQGRSYKLFNAGTLATVRFVIGEFYWQVEVGEQTQASDYIAPPHIVSEERNAREVVWSAGEYMEGKELWQAFSLPGDAPKPHDVSPAQPMPAGAKLTFPFAFAGITTALLVALFFLLQPKDVSMTFVDGPVQVPIGQDQTMAQRGRTSTTTPSVPNLNPLTPTTTPPAVTGPSSLPTVTPPFVIPANVKAVDVQISSNMGNGWMGVACALVNETTGQLTEFNIEEDRFHSTSPDVSTVPFTRTVTIADLSPGTHRLRLDPRWARKSTTSTALAPTLTMKVTSASREGADGCCCCSAAGLLFFPVIIVWFKRRSFESRRWQQSNLA